MYWEGHWSFKLKAMKEWAGEGEHEGWFDQ